MHRNIEHVEAEITRWIKGVDEYQISKDQVTHNADPQLSIDYIITHELKDMWYHFQLFATSASRHEDDFMHLQANQRLLKTCAAARGALFWSYVLETKPEEVTRANELANDKTWEVLAAHYEQLRNDPSQYPKSTMAFAPLTSVIHPVELLDGQDTPNLKTIFEKVAGIALVHLASAPSFVLPMPGTRSGEIVKAS